MNSRRSSIGATTPLKLRPKSSVETPPNNFVIDTGSLEDGIEERKIVMADGNVIGSERVYRMFRPDPGLCGIDVMEDPSSSAGRELQTFHLVTYILQLSDTYYRLKLFTFIHLNRPSVNQRRRPDTQPDGCGSGGYSG